MPRGVRIFLKTPVKSIFKEGKRIAGVTAEEKSGEEIQVNAKAVVIATGGIKINHKTEVLDNDHSVIPGLYAAGNDAASIYAGDYIFLLPANTMGFALNTGRMAGEYALEYIKQKIYD